MGIKDLIQNMSRKDEPEENPVEAEQMDAATRDKQLRSLRRQFRVQNEEKEKEMLIRRIRANELEHERRFMWGFKTPAAGKRPAKRRRKQSSKRRRKRGYLAKYDLKGKGGLM